MKEVFLVISSLRCIPHVFMFLITKNKNMIIADRDRWLDIMEIKHKGIPGLLYLLTFKTEYRNLFYYRIGKVGYILNVLCPKEKTLYIHTKTIGEGLFIQHGFATIISAHAIGRNCWINQQVTMGFCLKGKSPTILDNVKISAGAKVFGGITIGENSTVGANAVVVKNVPKNCVVVGVPAYIIKQDGLKVDKSIITPVSLDN